MAKNIKIENVKFRGWRIVKNEDGYFDCYHPYDAEAYSLKDLIEDCSAELEGFPTLEVAKDAIKHYND